MKYSGLAGFNEKDIEVRPGVLQNQIKERRIKGNVLNYGHYNSDTPNSMQQDVSIRNRLSIIMDPYIKKNFNNILYVTFMNVRWSISSLTINGNRVILDLGGVYNG